MNASRIQKKARKEIKQFQSEDTSFKEPAIKWLDRKFWGFDTSVAWDTAPGWLLLKNRKHTYRQQNLSFFFTYNIHAQYILYVFEEFQLKPVFKIIPKAQVLVFSSKSEPSNSDQGPVGTLSYILWGKLSTKKITVWLIFKSKRRSNTITYPRWKPQTVDFLLETHHILRRNSVLVDQLIPLPRSPSCYCVLLVIRLKTGEAALYLGRNPTWQHKQCRPTASLQLSVQRWQSCIYS